MMHHRTRRPHLFDGYGIEVEYMILDRTSRRVAPLSPVLLQNSGGSTVNERPSVRGCLVSNELVKHVIELKTDGPRPRLAGLAEAFRQTVQTLNILLEPHGACLAGGGMHPLMDPAAETVRWDADDRVIYDTYHRIFGTFGHGWSNLQSMHLNLPFGDDREFGRLHAAVRLVLPLVPALAAASPAADGRLSGPADLRLFYYQANQSKIPSVAGAVIPEPVFDPDEYRVRILEPMYRDIAPYDPDGILQHEWLNSRGAIPRFERSAIEIRLADAQECPAADCAVAAAVTALIRGMTEERWCPLRVQRQAGTESLSRLLQRTVRDAEHAVLDDPDYAALFGVSAEPEMTAGTLLARIFEDGQLEPDPHLGPEIWKLLVRGTLSSRLRRYYRTQQGVEGMRSGLARLSRCMASGEAF